jgi:formylglycine-generating enzyme required for sulfatase activity
VILLLWLGGCEPDTPAVELPTADPPAVELPCTGTTCDAYGCWVALCGGIFPMGSPDGVGDGDEHPVHEVTVDSFQMNQTEVTLPAWTDCLNAGLCAEAAGKDEPNGPSYPSFVDDPLCNRSEQGDDLDLPVNCIDWYGAAELCQFLGGRLPTEAEWEYAARDLGQDVTYPWGDDPPSCDNVHVDTEEFDLVGDCQYFGTYPVCSLPGGNTAQGLCDMAGNVIEWTEDAYHMSYDGAPSDGSSWNVPPNDFKVMRGGGTGSDADIRASKRIAHKSNFWYPGLGVRCVR